MNHKQKGIKSTASLLILIPLISLLGSCRSKELDFAQEFGTLAQALNTANSKISTDIYASCARAAIWESQGTSMSRKNSKKQLNSCNLVNLPNSRRANTASQVLIDYGLAIGNLATENEQGFSTQFTAISDALGNLKIGDTTINENARAAGVGLANFVTNILVRDYRKRNIKLAVICTDPDIQEYSKSLSSFYEDSYVNFSLDREIKQISEYYGFYIEQVNKKVNILAEVNDQHQEFELLQKRQTLLEEEEKEKISEVTGRKRDGDAYVAMIRSTADFHGKLKKIFNNNKGELSEKQKNKCSDYRKDNQDLVVQENDVVQEKISIFEIAKAQQAAKEYISEISPMIAEIQN